MSWIVRTGTALSTQECARNVGRYVLENTWLGVQQPDVKRFTGQSPFVT